MEHGAVGHTLSVVRKQKEMDSGSQLIFSIFLFIQSGTPVCGGAATLIEYGASLETLSQMCLLFDSKSNQVGKNDEP